ncbi:MAG TPA: hypothetical protein VK878_23255 [Candidatus Deferrimicrobiaceae bacterium]|nr:hypothetical protein [Candidatus Deferrimicrobiaceae bacterium]
MSSLAEGEQPYDLRHNTNPPAHYFTEPPQEPTLSTAFVAVSSGLVWRIAPNVELQDIGRLFTDSDVLDNVHVVDLRTMLAHLDCAARAIQHELDRRNGR